jgi:hypothetical protein
MQLLSASPFDFQYSKTIRLPSNHNVRSFKRELIKPQLIEVQLLNGERAQHLACDTRPWNTVEEFNATRDRHEQWRARRARGGHDRQLKTLEDWDTGHSSGMARWGLSIAPFG